MKEILGLIGIIALIFAPFAAWLTHIVWWINLAMAEEIDTGGEICLAIIGSVVPPIGAIHGFILWF